MVALYLTRKYWYFRFVPSSGTEDTVWQVWCYVHMDRKQGRYYTIFCPHL